MRIQLDLISKWRPEGISDIFVSKRGFRFMQLSIYFVVKVGTVGFEPAKF